MDALKALVVRFIEQYPDKPALARTVLVGGAAVLGLLNLLHSVIVAPQIQAPVNRFNWWLGTLITTGGLLVWPWIIYRFADPTNTIVLVFGAAGTVALGIFLSGRARSNERTFATNY